MIVYHLWRRGLWRSFDRQKWRYFLGREENRLFLSRVYPLWRSLRIGALVFRPRYAAAVAGWLEYRMALYEGRQG